MGHWHVLLGLLLLWLTPAHAQLRVGIGFPDASIEIRLSTYPSLVQIPGYPVYYAPRLAANYFFYDGMYWVYQRDDWYASFWYDGPWALVEPESVPVYMLRVPVRYYRNPPPYFRGWRSSAPPRWDEHWGRDWSDRRQGWDRWDRRSAPAPAPLPTYQRKYRGDRYPTATQQWFVHSSNYRYQARDPVVRQYYQVAPTHGEGEPRPAPREGGWQPTQEAAPAPQHSVPAAQEPRGRPRPAGTPAPSQRARQQPEATLPPHPRAQPAQAQREARPRGRPAEPRTERQQKEAHRGQRRGQDEARERDGGADHK